jgi:hypothetical protein
MLFKPKMSLFNNLLKSTVKPFMTYMILLNKLFKSKVSPYMEPLQQALKVQGESIHGPSSTRPSGLQYLR